MDWHTLTSIVIDCAGEIGARWRAISSSPYFHRFELVRETELEIVDFVEEKCPQLDAEKPELGTIRFDTLREIGTNKLCAILGRSDIKDLVDLYFLDQAGFTATHHIDDAKRKDGGFEPGTFSYVLSQMDVHEIPLFLIKPIDPAALTDFLRRVQREFAALAFPGN